MTYDEQFFASAHIEPCVIDKPWPPEELIGYGCDLDPEPDVIEDEDYVTLRRPEYQRIVDAASRMPQATPERGSRVLIFAAAFVAGLLAQPLVQQVCAWMDWFGGAR